MNAFSYELFINLRLSVHLRGKSAGVLTREGDSNMKQTGMLVVSLRGVNSGFWSRLGFQGKAPIF